jgi:HSP20 family protein
MSANEREGEASTVRHDEIYREFEQTFGPRAHGRFEPNADVYVDEAGERFIVHVELAGSVGNDLRVAIDDRHLTISGHRTDRGEHRSASMLRKEILYGAFFKKIRLPLPVDDAGATASYRDGILTIALPLASHDRIPTVTTEIRMTVTRTLA